MKAPLYDFGLFGDGTALLLALPIGFAFGWCLERGGLGNARKLAGQFYLTDLTVFKVMFSAIVTAALGAFWLSRIGWLDLSRVAVPPTYLIPQLAGGLIFGVGFVAGGLCPGTGCVAAASGRADGLALIGGMLAGVFLFGELSPRLDGFYQSTARGALTLPDVLPLSRGATVFLIAALALSGFAAAEAIERRAGETR
jgi:uncharacterized membrane protein YedE/YeeE